MLHILHLEGARGKEIEKEAIELKAGCDGLVFLPFLSGERAPGWRLDATGSYTGRWESNFYFSF